MSRSRMVSDPAGPVGVVDEPIDSPDGGDGITVRLNSGGRIVVPEALLAEQPDGSLRLSVTLEQLHSSAPPRQEGTQGDTVSVESIPVSEEQARVVTQPRTVERVRVRIEPQVRQEVVDVPLASEQIEVRRVPIERIVESAPPVRQEGQTTIVPVLEEVLVVERKLMLREEIHIERHRTVRQESQQIELRREEAHIERQSLAPHARRGQT